MASRTSLRGTLSPSVFFAFAPLSSVAAQSIPAVLPGNWSSIGCYTDISTSRTLAATFTSSDNMTVEACIAFCDGAGYNYAGVEFGRECYCDSTIQIPGSPTALSDCTLPCTGNPSESCGSSGRLNVLSNGAPAPVLVQNVSVPQSGGGTGTWAYQGCFVDATDRRTLGVPVGVPEPAGGVTAERCVAACASAGYVYAGMEIGRECWCDSALNAPAQRVADDDCRMVCAADHTEYCGNTDRVAVYRLDSGSGSGGGGAGGCVQTDVANFTLAAVARNGGGGSGVKLKVVLAEMVPGIAWGVLSACPTCCSEWPYFSLQNSIVRPQSPWNPSLDAAASVVPGDGETPSFVSSGSNPPGPGPSGQGYCTMEDATSTLLAFNGKADAFSLCSNQTANGRLDVVFSPVTGHPHYSLDTCSPVSIQVIIGAV